MTTIHEITKLGQSIWYDNIRRLILQSGEFQELLDKGVRGVTSNPTIFEKAIVGSHDYDEDLVNLVEQGKSVGEIYEALALADIGQGADFLRPIYEESDGADGFISLEVSPTLAHDTVQTIAEAKRLFAALERPNVMIKVPATPEGIPAIETLIGAGINVNVTLIFSLEQYEAVANAYIKGLEKLAETGGDVSRVASVASFFVSRVDTLIDKKLAEKANTTLQGKIAVANAKLAYARFCKLFGGERWDKLAAKGARVQRPLWASTGTKNPVYSDTLYIDTLIGPHTVNTVPPATLDALLDHATVASTIEIDLEEAQAQIKQLAESGVSLDEVTAQLLEDGVAAFAKSFESLMAGIEAKCALLRNDWHTLSVELGEHQQAVSAALERMHQDKILTRIQSHDHTVWSPSPDEVTNRLGWLSIAEGMHSEVSRIESLVSVVREAGYTHALLLGMGGSSLAPEVFRRTFGVHQGYLDLAVLDSTDPGAVLAHAARLDLTRTLFIVSTKSGGTVETFSFFKFFYNRVMEAVGREKAGEHFIAITDPGSKLVDTAQQYNFRDVFLNDPNIGGRYSALSHFGLVPAALIGVDIGKLLERARAMMSGDETVAAASKNIRAMIGASMGALALAGRDKVTFFISPSIESFGDWVEQLIAESTGKSGKGILPVVGEPVGAPTMYGDDRLFVSIQLRGDQTYDDAVTALKNAGHPLVTIRLEDEYDLGGQFYLWEMATAIAGHVIGVQPFDQPNVESAKVLARKMVAAYSESGMLPPQEAVLEENGISVYGDVNASGLGGVVKAFLGQVKPGDYIALQAYLQPTSETDAALADFRQRLYPTLTNGRGDSGWPKVATTLGYGPRFLHSTGQLHKGDRGNGVFIQFTADPIEDAAIPDEAGKPELSMTFGVLKMAQALGDGEALQENGRRVIRFHLGQDVVSGLKTLADALP